MLHVAPRTLLASVKQLYLIRHCETRELAGEEAAHPRNDSPLTAAGLRQAERLADYLRAEPIDLILTSLFERSQKTAAALNRGRGAPVFQSMTLNEYFLRDDYGGVETTEQGAARALTFLYQFSPYFEHVAVVAHNSILSTVLAAVLNLPFDEGKEAFGRAGTCRLLRYDHARGDQNWRQVDCFIP